MGEPSVIEAAAAVQQLENSCNVLMAAVERFCIRIRRKQGDMMLKCKPIRRKLEAHRLEGSQKRAVAVRAHAQRTERPDDLPRVKMIGKGVDYRIK